MDYLKQITIGMVNLTLQGTPQIDGKASKDGESSKDNEQVVQQQFYIQSLYRKNRHFINKKIEDERKAEIAASRKDDTRTIDFSRVDFGHSYNVLRRVKAVNHNSTIYNHQYTIKDMTTSSD